MYWYVLVKWVAFRAMFNSHSSLQLSFIFTFQVSGKLNNHKTTGNLSYHPPKIQDNSVAVVEFVAKKGCIVCIELMAQQNDLKHPEERASLNWNACATHCILFSVPHGGFWCNPPSPTCKQFQFSFLISFKNLGL